MPRTYEKKVDPPQSYQAWGNFPEGPMDEHPVYGRTNPAKAVLRHHLIAQGWSMDARSAEWVNADGTRHARMATSPDGMSAWLMYGLKEGDVGWQAGPYGTHLLPPDSHRITLS